MPTSPSDLPFQDWYAVLGIGSDATDLQVQNAWRRMAQRHHPDRTRVGSDPFVLAKHAFDVLSDPLQRASFDRARTVHLNRWSQSTTLQTSGTLPLWQRCREVLDGWNTSRVRPVVQADRASAWVRVPLAQIMTGTDVVVRLRVARTCPVCQGTQPHCRRCGGTGQILVPRSWKIAIPPGHPDRAVLRLPGQGHQGPRFEAPGDVLLTVVWTRAGPWRHAEGRLLARVRVSPALLSAGGSIRLRSPRGEWGSVKVHSTLAQVQLLRLPGLGLPAASGRPADAWVECYLARR